MTVIDALAEMDQPNAVFSALEAEVQERIGAKLFTVMTLDREAGLARRHYSNMPEAYPISGDKPMQENAWSQQVIDKHETFVANSIEEIASVFPDHELIRSLGCESCINIPIIFKGTVIGTLNCLDRADHFSPERVAKADTLKTSGALALLVALKTKDVS